MKHIIIKIREKELLKKRMCVSYEITDFRKRKEYRNRNIVTLNVFNHIDFDLHWTEKIIYFHDSLYKENNSDNYNLCLNLPFKFIIFDYVYFEYVHYNDYYKYLYERLINKENIMIKEKTEDTYDSITNIENKIVSILYEMII